MTLTFLQSVRPVCALGVFALMSTMTGCSAFQPTSHVVEPETPLSPYAMASADGALVAEPFSLVAADSIGLATFGFEIALWDQIGADHALAEAPGTSDTLKALK